VVLNPVWPGFAGFCEPALVITVIFASKSSTIIYIASSSKQKLINLLE
jgi:hypothetical protein